MDIKNKLFNYSKEDYGNDYNTHLFEQYKLYVEMADKISSRRQVANSFFLSINTGLVAIAGYIGGIAKVNFSPLLFLVIGLCGMILCYMWYRLVRLYKDINTGKFKVIHEIEKKLPLSPYTTEWVVLEEGKNPKIYLPFTHIEMGIPWVFFTIHAFVLLINIPWGKICT